MLLDNCSWLAGMAFLQLLVATVGVFIFAQPSQQQGIALPPPINEDLVAEGHIFLDPKALEKYRHEETNEADAQAAAKQDAEYLITEANTYYDSLRQYGLKLQIRIVSIEILSQDLVTGSEITNGNVVEEQTILDNFGDFLKSSARSGDEYDFAILFTGYDLSDPTAGFAQLGSVCDEYSRGVVEFHGGFGTAGTFAHEAGHIFGSEHDPDGAPYIMAPKASNEDDDRIYQFSPVTADFILTHFRQPYRDFSCLRQTSSSSTTPNMTPERYDGKMQDIEALCKRTTDPNSTPCTNSFFYNNQSSIAGDSVCFHVACRRPDNPKSCVTSVKTPEGMPCGLNKACKRGKCVSAPSAKTSNVNEKCLFGDDKNPNGVGMSCPVYVKEEGGNICNRREQFTSCCETCPKYETGWPDCPYGDVSTIKWNGVEQSCPEIVATSGLNELCSSILMSCCATCHIPDNLKDSACPYGDDNFLNVNSEKISCDDAFSRYGGKAKLCKNPYYSERCCQSCQITPGSSQECPFGDAASINVNSQQWTCADAISNFGKDNLCGNPNLAELCCESCGDDSGSSDTDGTSDTDDTACNDAALVNVNGMDMTCPEMIAMFTQAQGCANADLAKACCESCSSKTSTPACQDDASVNINDTPQTCKQAKYTYGLYELCDGWGMQHCCETCKVPPGNPSSCRYGDIPVTVNGKRQSCAKAAKTYGKDWLCSSDIEPSCCITCG